jgi:hypothetical protein
MAALYLRFVWIVITAYLVPFTILELVVLSTMLARISALFLVPSWRRSNPALMFDILSIELLIVPAVLLVGLVTGSGFFPALCDQIFVAWLFALLVTGPSIMIFRFSKALLDGVRLSIVLPTSAAIFAGLWSLQGISAAPTVSGGASSLLGNYLGGLSQGATELVSSPIVAVAGVAAFISMGLYAALVKGYKVEVRARSLLLVLLGIVGAFAWVAGMSFVTGDMVLSLSVPTTALGALMWWATREG